MKSVYVETTVIGTIASRNHPDPLILARQTISRRWWSSASMSYGLYISDLVVTECSAGDHVAALERMRIIDEINVLTAIDEAESLGQLLLDRYAIPTTEPRDAAHIAIAAAHGVDFLVTWNFKHILNPHTLPLIESIIRDSGFTPPVICTPEQLLETFDDSRPSN